MATEIVTEGEPVLRHKAKPVKRVNTSIRRLLDEMVDTMREANGVGLAAPQIGVSKRVIVVDIGQGLHEIINPEILSSEGSVQGIEGCLSVPGWIGEVERAESIRVTGLDRDGRQIWLDACGFLARALQHEIDHLDGVLFVDKAISITEVKDEDEAQAEDLPASKLEPFRIVYMGTPEFAIAPLECLLAAGHQVVQVVTQPDRKGNRGRIEVPAVKQYALDAGLAVVQPHNVRDEQFVDLIAKLEPDFIVVAAFGQILPAALLDVPKFGAVNVHASLLPAYRGAAPVQRAIMNGEQFTGVTIMKMDIGLDTGDIILQEKVAIEADDDSGTLAHKIAAVGANLLPKALLMLTRQDVELRKQDDANASYAPRLTARDEIVDWSLSARQIALQVRALSPLPGARTKYKDRWLKIWKASVCYGGPNGLPGTLVRAEESELLVLTSDQTLRIIELQPAGKKRMTAEEFLRGYRPEPAARFSM